MYEMRNDTPGTEPPRSDGKRTELLRTEKAVSELVNVAFKLHGGKGKTGSRILRPRITRKGTNKRMFIYIAGAITGLDEDMAAESFRNASELLLLAGHEPLNPMEMVRQCDDTLDFESGLIVETRERPYNDALIDALRIVLDQADALYMLPNWTQSLGARIEHAIAIEKKLPIYYAGSILPMTWVDADQTNGR